MEIINTNFKDLKIYNKISYKDKRGYTRELFKNNSIKEKFPFDLLSLSKKNVIRGLHLQIKRPQGKFVSVLKGKVFDVALDCRKNSKTFGKYFSVIISHTDDFSFYIPENFAHGFLCLSKSCTINYKCSKYRNQKYERTLSWNDPDVNIKWQIKKPILSKRDRLNGLKLKNLI